VKKEAGEEKEHKYLQTELLYSDRTTVQLQTELLYSDRTTVQRVWNAKAKVIATITGANGSLSSRWVGSKAFRRYPQYIFQRAATKDSAHMTNIFTAHSINFKCNFQKLLKNGQTPCSKVWK
jgi:hypothetical protein